MKCSYHPEAEALDICPACRRPICEQCSVQLSGENYCRPCLEKRVDGLSGQPGGKSRFWAFVLSLVPGGGYYYLGLMKRGLQTMAIFFGAIFIGALTHLEAITAFVAPVLMFYSVFDTQQLLGRLNRGEAVDDRELFDWGSWQSRRGIIGGTLIVVGLLALLDNMMPYFFRFNIIRTFAPPLLIIGVGVYILYRNTAGKGGITGADRKQDD